MKNTLRAFPELFCIDATYKLNNIRAPVYLILVDDGNGESEVVAVALLTSEEKEIIVWFLNKFKEINPALEKTKNIMADKDWTERDVLKECFPRPKFKYAFFTCLKYSKEK